MYVISDDDGIEPDKRIEQRKRILKAKNTFNHCCGQKKSTYIREKLMEIENKRKQCGCYRCYKWTSKSKNKGKGFMKDEKYIGNDIYI